MSLRQTLNQNPAIIVVAVIIVIGVAAWFTYRNVAPAPQAGGNIYFTDDDGKTFFNGSKGDFSPMQHDGKTAYRAYVFKCADGQKFVGYMERTPEDIIALIQKAKASPDSITNQEKGRLMMAGQMKQMKKPGQEKWVPMPANGVPVACPDGKPAQAAD